MSSREFDIIIYGASGYTGRLVAEYLQAEYGGSGLKWAMAGRNAEKLQTVAGEMKIGGNVAVITANSDEPESLAALAARTKAIITTVGPYQLYGEPLVKACAEAGTDYVDLCGEPAWMKDMIDRYDVAAKKSGARIVLSCGFDSIPFDLGVYHLQKQAIETHGGPCERVRCRVRGMKGTFSGGTAASFMETMKRAQKQPEILEWLKDPFSLSPEKGVDQPPIHKPMEEADLGSWATPFIMASINTKNVHRSNALMGYKYGRDFKYGEMVLTGPAQWSSISLLSPRYLTNEGCPAVKAFKTGGRHIRPHQDKGQRRRTIKRGMCTMPTVWAYEHENNPATKENREAQKLV